MGLARSDKSSDQINVFPLVFEIWKGTRPLVNMALRIEANVMAFCGTIADRARITTGYAPFDISDMSFRDRRHWRAAVRGRSLRDCGGRRRSTVLTGWGLLQTSQGGGGSRVFPLRQGRRGPK